MFNVDITGMILTSKWLRTQPLCIIITVCRIYREKQKFMYFCKINAIIHNIESKILSQKY